MAGNGGNGGNGGLWAAAVATFVAAVTGGTRAILGLLKGKRQARATEEESYRLSIDHVLGVQQRLIDRLAQANAELMDRISGLEQQNAEQGERLERLERHKTVRKAADEDTPPPGAVAP